MGQGCLRTAWRPELSPVSIGTSIQKHDSFGSSVSWGQCTDAVRRPGPSCRDVKTGVRPFLVWVTMCEAAEAGMRHAANLRFDPMAANVSRRLFAWNKAYDSLPC